MGKTSWQPSSNETEAWKPIPNFSNYAVSNFGRVMTIKSGRMLSLYRVYATDSRGRITNRPKSINVGLKNGNKTHTKMVHRLVLGAFLGDCAKDKTTVDHKDRNPFNNELENLRWASFKDQSNNSILRRKNDIKFSMVDINNMYEMSKSKTHTEIGKHYGVSLSVIYYMLRYVHPDY